MLLQKKYPFKFLDAYTRDDREQFFGRREEIEALYQMVFQTDLILICGASGTGKTSLIQCGLANKFQPYEWMALSIRRGNNLNDSLEKALVQVGGARGASGSSAGSLDWLDEAPETAEHTPLSPLAQMLKNLYLRHFKPIFLIFDQFEELYILGDKEEQRRFMDSVRDMLRLELPVKIIISIREEYLGYLYEFERKVPELLHKKMRVEPMHLTKVQEVLRGMCNPEKSLVKLRAGEEDRFGEELFNRLKAHENVRTIELPYLQVLLDKLYLQVTGNENKDSEAEFSLAALNEMGKVGDVLAVFLDDQVKKNARELETSTENIKKLLAHFVTLDGTKEPLSADMLHRRVADLKLSPDFVARSLQAFQNSQILRFDEKEQRYEVKHDSLARQIASYRDAEDIALQKAAQVIRTQLLMDGEVFTEKQLLFLEPYLPKLEMSAEEKARVEKSREHWDRIKTKEKERQQLELENTRKRLRLVRGLLLAAVVAIGAAAYYGLEARKNADEAKASLDKMKASEQARLKSEISRYIHSAEKMRMAGDTAMARKILLEAPQPDSTRRDGQVDSLLQLLK